MHSQTSISGVVNSYYRVVEVIPSKACVRLNSVAGLARLQKVLMIQMKGASVITTNNSSFGDTTSLNNAGNYELAVICAINGDSVFMFHNFLNSYTVSGKVQLVKFAEYYSADVVDTVKALPWNNTSGLGGVVAISVFQDLSLHAPISTDGLGFKGGGYALSDDFCLNGLGAATNYFYDASVINPQNGAYKGESVYDFPQSQSGGRGAPANGGGGGNNHNNAGGGGANLVAGGNGGGNSSVAGCTTEIHGLGGKPLKNWNGKKIFVGGGGGAGHSNGVLTISSGGGNGGGIIFVIAGSLAGNGYKISANGSKGGNAVSDGASGGGGGGTIIMSVPTYSGSLILEARGGKGGDEDDAGTNDHCYGAGGGGGGGAIYFTGSVPAVTTSIAGGAAGVEFGGDPDCLPPVLPVNGSNGNIISPYTIRQSTDSASYCLSIAPLPVRLISFKATASKSSVALQWRVANPELAREYQLERSVSGNWKSFGFIPADAVRQNYNYTDAFPEPGTNWYRLRIIEQDNSFFYSPVLQVNLNDPEDAFFLFPNPAQNRLNVTGNFSSLADIKLFDLNGKLIWSDKMVTNNNTLEVDLSSFPSGVYVLQINTVRKKLVIRK